MASRRSIPNPRKFSLGALLPPGSEQLYSGPLAEWPWNNRIRYRRHRYVKYEGPAVQETQDSLEISDKRINRLFKSRRGRRLIDEIARACPMTADYARAIVLLDVCAEAIILLNRPVMQASVAWRERVLLLTEWVMEMERSPFGRTILGRACIRDFWRIREKFLSSDFPDQPDFMNTYY